MSRKNSAPVVSVAETAPPLPEETKQAPTAEAPVAQTELLDRILTDAEEKNIMARSVKRDVSRYMVSSLDLTDPKNKVACVNAINLPTPGLKDLAEKVVECDGWIIEAKAIEVPETGEVRAGRALTLLRGRTPVASFASEISIEQFCTIRDSLDDSWPKPWRIFIHRTTNPKTRLDWFPLELLDPEEKGS